MTSHSKRAARAAATLAAVVLLIQAGSLVSRAARESSDFGVFFRSGQVLSEGSGAEFYESPDAPSGWYRTIPPAGLWPFVWLSKLGALGAGVVWALFNLALVAVSARLTSVTLRDLKVERTSELWGLAVLFVLSSASLQVGQFSVLFTCCWLAAAWALAQQRGALAGMALAAPAAIKLYPIFLAPMLFVNKRPTRSILFVAVGLMVFSLLLPLITLGPRTLSLVMSFANEVLVGSEGRVAGYLELGLGSVTNQGLDAVLRRYLSHSPEFHDRYPLPHVSAPALASAIAMGVRLLVVAMTLWGTWLARTRLSQSEAPLAALALWSSALYVVLPETKARYAVYLVPAFVWLFTRWERPVSRWRIGVAVFILLCVLGALPRFALVWGLAFSGSLLLWGLVMGQVRNLRSNAQPSRALEH